MLDKARSKIKAEMEQNAKSTYIKVVGNFLLQHLEAHPESSEKILIEDKTIKDSLAEMQKVAEKQKDGNVAVLTEQEDPEEGERYRHATLELISKMSARL